MVLPLTKATGKIATAPAGHEPPGRGSQTRFGNHCTPLPVAAAPCPIVTEPATSGRKVASPVSELAFAEGAPPIIAPALPAKRVTGFPLCDCTIAESCQPSKSWFLLNGSS